MKSFLHFILIEPFCDKDPFGYFMGVIMWVFSLFILGLSFYGLIYLVDSSFMPVKKKEGIIVNKYVKPEHTTTTYVISGKVIVPIINHYPTTYTLDISIDSLTDEINVNKDYYEQVKVGQTVYCKYTNGRLKKSLYIKDLE